MTKQRSFPTAMQDQHVPDFDDFFDNSSGSSPSDSKMEDATASFLDDLLYDLPQAKKITMTVAEAVEIAEGLTAETPSMKVRRHFKMLDEFNQHIVKCYNNFDSDDEVIYQKATEDIKALDEESRMFIRSMMVHTRDLAGQRAEMHRQAAERIGREMEEERMQRQAAAEQEFRTLFREQTQLLNEKLKQHSATRRVLSSRSEKELARG